MPGNTKGGGGKNYLKIVQGSIVQTVEKGTDGARVREYELKDGTKRETTELVFMNWFGTIQKITFKDTDFGRVCNIELDDAILSMNTSDRYFQDFACKLPSGDLKKPFLFHPYDIDGDLGKKKGISLQQDDMKLKNYYYDGGKKINGFPEVNEEERQELGKNYWKVYFAKTAAFLVRELSKLEFEKPKAVEPVDEKPELESTEDIESDLPWETK